MAGESASQRLLYERYVNAMYHIVIRMVGKAEDAEDVIQDTFIKVFNSLGSFRKDSTLGAWIKRIAINSALNFLKKEKRTQTVQLDERFNESPEEDVEVTSISMKRIHNAIKSLPDGSRAVLTLFLLEGYQHKEIASILDITESTSKTQYRRGKQLLKERLQ
jgi:RNA polymerase sigma-70 factor (ECF subfamily)